MTRTGATPAARHRLPSSSLAVLAVSAAAIVALALALGHTRPGTALHAVLVFALILAVVMALFGVLVLFNPRIASRWIR